MPSYLNIIINTIKNTLNFKDSIFEKCAPIGVAIKIFSLNTVNKTAIAFMQCDGDCGQPIFNYLIQFDHLTILFNFPF